ncbi:Uncharacterised protein [Bordetella pertussis]|nr:Uncharacterised protein [Bordetella pertussis]
MQVGAEIAAHRQPYLRMPAGSRVTARSSGRPSRTTSSRRSPLTTSRISLESASMRRA